MQYTKLGFNRLFKGSGSHQVPCSLIVNPPRWRGSVTRANISIHIANNKVTYE